jgi:hypothetical protein
MNTDSYINPDYLANRPTETCCAVCKKSEGCPFESVGRKCQLDHENCNVCNHWDERGCILFQFDKKFLKLQM